MKVLHVTPWNIRCGIAACTESLVAQLDQLGVENRIFPIVPHDMHTMVGEEFKTLFGKIRKEAAACDLVHIQHEFGFFTAPTTRSSIRNFGRLLSMLSDNRRPVLATYHTDPDFPVRMKFSRAGLRSAVLAYLWRRHVARHFRGRKGCHALVHTARGRQALIHSGFDYRHVSTVPMGHDIRELATTSEAKYAAKCALNLPVDSVVLSMFGFIIGHKGYRTAIRALKSLPKNYVLAVIGGRHPEAGEDRTLEDMLRSWRNEDPRRLIVTGYADRATIDLYQTVTDVCLAPYMPAFNLSASAALTWALTSGRPTVASGIPPFAEINRRGNCLFTVTPAAPRELAWAIRKVVEDTDLQEQLVRNALAFARRNSWHVAAQENLKVYEKALGAWGLAAGKLSPQTVGKDAAPDHDFSRSEKLAA